ncbi:hypothetical protein, partial [Arsenophonus apicola]
LRPMKIGIQQDMWQEVKEKCLPITRRRLRACLGSIGHHANYRALIHCSTAPQTPKINIKSRHDI